MPNTVTTSIVVSFSSGESGGLFFVEVDDREAADGGLNGGKTSFLPGDTVFLLAYKSSGVIIDGVQSSIGSMSFVGNATMIKSEDIIFAGETEVSVRYPIVSGLTYEWVGNSLGSISQVGDNTLRVPAPPSGAYSVGVAKCSYTTQAGIYRLAHSDPGYSEYDVVAFFAGHTP